MYFVINPIIWVGSLYSYIVIRRRKINRNQRIIIILIIVIINDKELVGCVCVSECVLYVRVRSRKVYMSVSVKDRIFVTNIHIFTYIKRLSSLLFVICEVILIIASICNYFCIYRIKFTFNTQTHTKTAALGSNIVQIDSSYY